MVASFACGIPGSQVCDYPSSFFGSDKIAVRSFVFLSFLILGYMLQFISNDESMEVLEKFPDGFLLSDADYNSAFAEKLYYDCNVDHQPTD